MRRFPVFALCLLFAGVPAGLLYAQSAKRFDISGVAQVMRIHGTDEGSLPLGARVGYRTGSHVALEGQVTLGTTLGDGDNGDLITTVGARVDVKAGNSLFGFVVRPGFLSCPGNCSAVGERGEYFALYIGALMERPASSRWFFRADIGTTMMDLEGAQRDFGATHAPQRLTGNVTFGIGVGVQF